LGVIQALHPLALLNIRNILYIATLDGLQTLKAIFLAEVRINVENS